MAIGRYGPIRGCTSILDGQGLAKVNEYLENLGYSMPIPYMRGHHPILKGSVMHIDLWHHYYKKISLEEITAILQENDLSHEQVLETETQGEDILFSVSFFKVIPPTR